MAKSKGRYIIEFNDIPKERQVMPKLAVEERAGNFNEVELGFDREQAVAEAKRCLSCRRCLGCALCLAECHTKAINFDQPDSDIELEVSSIIITPEVERVPSRIEAKFGYDRYINVVTSLEFERMLNDSGPYGGLVVRPYDGEIPGRIAFVPTLGTWDIHSLSYTMKEALIAQSKFKDLDISILSIDGIPQGEFRKYFPSSVSLRKGKVLAIREVEENKNLIVEFAEDKEIKEEEFEMVVLLVGLELGSEVIKLSSKLGLKLNRRNFWETGDTSLIETAKSGVFFAGHSFLGLFDHDQLRAD